MTNNVYFWWGLALLLMAAETFMPGAFLLWFGFAAAAMGFVVWLLPIGLLWQAVLFSIFSLISIAIYWRFFRGREPVSEQPLLNRRAEQLIGRTLVLENAIVDGYGKIRINDALWTVMGDPAPAGARVTVTAVDGMNLRVRLAE